MGCVLTLLQPPHVRVQPCCAPSTNKTNCCRQHRLLQWQLLVSVADTRVLGHHLPVTPHHPFAGQQALHAHRPAGMDAAGADAHFSTQPEPAHMTATAAGQTNVRLVSHLLDGQFQLQPCCLGLQKINTRCNNTLLTSCCKALPLA